MLWHAMPPEVNTGRLMTGAGPAPMLQAAAGWQSLAASLTLQADELAASLHALGEAWTGQSSETALAAALPMVAWLHSAAAMAQLRATRATAQAAAYTQALATTPTLPDIAANHITNAVLTATNFLGINLVPIAFNEMDYFVRMWNQAAVAMDVYQAQTSVNTMFADVEPMAPILVPTVTEMATDIATFISQLPISQLSSTMGQIQQMASSFTGMGQSDITEEPPAQLGLLGVGPLSNHPLAGGTGPSMGAGLMRAESLPGSLGSAARTPMLAQLVEKPGTPGASMAAVAAGSSAAGGAAPLGMGGRGAQSESTRSGLAAPALLALEPDEFDRHETDDDDW
jgi:PPE-repeat protein